MIFNTWFGYFDYVGYLPHGIRLIVLNYYFDLIAINFTWSTRPLEHRPARNLQQEISQIIFNTFDQSLHLRHTLHKFFVHFSCVFTFLEIMKHNMTKMLLFSSIFITKMATQKLTNFVFSFFFLKEKSLYFLLTLLWFCFPLLFVCFCFLVFFILFYFIF